MAQYETAIDPINYNVVLYVPCLLDKLTVPFTNKFVRSQTLDELAKNKFVQKDFKNSKNFVIGE